MRRWQDLSEDDWQVWGFNLLRLSQGKEISLSDVLSETPAPWEASQEQRDVSSWTFTSCKTCYLAGGRDFILFKASAQSTTCANCVSLNTQCTPWQPSLYSLSVNHRDPARAAALVVRCVQQICSLAPSWAVSSQHFWCAKGERCKASAPLPSHGFGSGTSWSHPAPWCCWQWCSGIYQDVCVSPSLRRPLFQASESRIRSRHDAWFSFCAHLHAPWLLLGLWQQERGKFMTFARYSGTGDHRWLEGIADIPLNRLKILIELLSPQLLSSRNVPSAVPMVSHLGTAPMLLHRD